MLMVILFGLLCSPEYSNYPHKTFSSLFFIPWNYVNKYKCCIFITIILNKYKYKTEVFYKDC